MQSPKQVQFGAEGEMDILEGKAFDHAHGGAEDEIFRPISKLHQARLCWSVEMGWTSSEELGRLRSFPDCKELSAEHLAW